MEPRFARMYAATSCTCAMPRTSPLGDRLPFIIAPQPLADNGAIAHRYHEPVTSQCPSGLRLARLPGRSGHSLLVSRARPCSGSRQLTTAEDSSSQVGWAEVHCSTPEVHAMRRWLGEVSTLEDSLGMTGRLLTTALSTAAEPAPAQQVPAAVSARGPGGQPRWQRRWLGSHPAPALESSRAAHTAR